MNYSRVGQVALCQLGLTYGYAVNAALEILNGQSDARAAIAGVNHLSRVFARSLNEQVPFDVVVIHLGEG
jgi:hypothetical protein